MGHRTRQITPVRQGQIFSYFCRKDDEQKTLACNYQADQISRILHINADTLGNLPCILS